MGRNMLDKLNFKKFAAFTTKIPGLWGEGQNNTFYQAVQAAVAARRRPVGSDTSRRP